MSIAKDHPLSGMAVDRPKVGYTCPTHLEIMRSTPDSCPVCGMALELATEGIAEEKNLECRNLRLRCWGSTVFMVPLLAIAIARMMIPVASVLPQWLSTWGELVLASPVVLWGAKPVFLWFWISLKNRTVDTFTLVGVGVGVSYLYGVVAVAAPNLFPVAFHFPGNLVLGVYFELAAFITVLALLGQLLELRARSRTSSAIRGLLDLLPQTAQLIQEDGSTTDIPLTRVRPGDLLRVGPGDKLPADGVVLEGLGLVDESMITGESTVAEKGPGSHVIGGTVNRAGALQIRTERIGSATVLARFAQMVGDAQRSRAPIQKSGDKVAAWFVPAVVAISLAAAVVWALFGPQPKAVYAIVNAVAVLIFACPGTLGLAAPMAIMAGTGRGTTAGVLIKNTVVLETLEKVDTLVVDKTGTLTQGRPEVVSVVLRQDDLNLRRLITCLKPAPTYSHDQGIVQIELLRLVASLERASGHPLATAIVQAAKAKRLALRAVFDFESLPGRGVVGRVDGWQVGAGNERWLEEMNIQIGNDIKQQAETLQHDGQTVIYVTLDGQPAGLMGIADPIKPSAPEVIRSLHAEGVHVLMLTGDNQGTAQTVARKLGLEEYQAEVLPEMKSEVVKRLQAQGHIVAVAGDGINDAPALAQAHVGIAMGTGTDVILESGGVVLVKGDLRAIVWARCLSGATMRTVRQNLFLACVYNALSVPIAAGVLYPWVGVLSSPMIAEAAMGLGLLSVLANSLRLCRTRLSTPSA